MTVTPNNQNQSRAFNEKAAASYIGMSVSFLQKDRMNGKINNRTPGPRYAKLGKRVVYLREDLDTWLQSHVIGQAQSMLKGRNDIPTQ